MQEPKAPPSFSRTARLEDFFDKDEIITQNKNKNKNSSNNSHNYKIEKNQHEYGNRKRIKP